MSEKIDLSIGIALGFVFGLGTTTLLVKSNGFHSPATEIVAKNECEESLPRNERCVMRFIKDESI